MKKIKQQKSTKKQFLAGLRESIKELNLVKDGKLKGIPAKDLLNDLK